MSEQKTAQVRVELAGLAIDFVTSDVRSARLCSSRYRAFASSATRAADLTIDLTIGSSAELAPHADASDLRVEDSGALFSFSRADYVGTLDLDSLHARVGCARKEYSLNSCVRVLCAVSLAKRGGFLVHAASVERNGQAYLFPGKSGAGKTTIARLSTDGRVLSDEISAIRRVGSQFHCFSTPFWGDLVPTREENLSAPVAGVFFPVQATQAKRTRLTPAQAASQLLESIVLFGANPALTENVLETACDFAHATDSALLHFRPDPSFWSCIGA